MHTRTTNVRQFTGFWFRLLLALPLLLIVSLAKSQDAEPLNGPRTGEFRLSFALSDVIGVDAARSLEAVVQPDERITWQLYVPDRYQPQIPVGLMVYISPSGSGRLPRGWTSVMDDKNLIWIAAYGAGNKVPVVRRAVFAMVGRTVAGTHYNIDPERVYLSGFSGGAKVAGMVAADHPHWFKGAIFTGGARFWGEDTPKRIEMIRANHYVFMAGAMDQALQPTRKVYKQFLSSGVENSKLIMISKLGHRTPSSNYFGQAVQYLDSRLDQ